MTRYGVLVRRARPRESFTLEELARRCGVQTGFVRRLIHIGVVEPHPDHPEYVRPETSLQVRRIVRLYEDLGVNLEGGAIIVELLDRIERLESELAAMRGR